MTALAFIAAAGAGTAARHVVNLQGFTWRGTLAVNVFGALLLGALVGTQPSASTFTIIGVGFLGSLTTFSMFALEVAEAPRLERIVIATATLVAGIGAAAIGFAAA